DFGWLVACPRLRSGRLRREGRPSTTAPSRLTHSSSKLPHSRLSLTTTHCPPSARPLGGGPTARLEPIPHVVPYSLTIRYPAAARRDRVAHTPCRPARSRRDDAARLRPRVHARVR